MDDRARERGGKPRYGFEKRPATHAVGHAERAVDDLRGEADDDEKKKFTPSSQCVSAFQIVKNGIGEPVDAFFFAENLGIQHKLGVGRLLIRRALCP